MLSRSGIFVVLLAGLVFTAADDSETERNVAELEVETLVSCVKFFSPPYNDLCEQFLQKDTWYPVHTSITLISACNAACNVPKPSILHWF